jgi:hypothetical protein
MIFSSLVSKPMAIVSPDLISKPVVGFLVELQNQGGRGFSDLDFKTSSYGLMIWASKSSSLRFVGCAIKLMGAQRHGTRVGI